MDLTHRKASEEPLPVEWQIEYLGGRGLAYRYLLDGLNREVGPLDPECKMVLMVGPLAGTLVPTSSWMAVAAQSPANGKFACDMVGGGAAAELKFAGYDGIIISGKAAVPTFLYVTDQRITFERANTLWGTGAQEAERAIQEKKWTYRARVLVIGPDGEKLAPSACLTSDGRRQGGKVGLGAVMGSKNLKAVALRGHGGVRVADMPGFLDFILEYWGEGARENRGRWARAEGEAACVSCPTGCGYLSDGEVSDFPANEAATIWDSLAVCRLWRPPLDILAEAFCRVTGVPTTPEVLRQAGERIETLERLLTDSTMAGRRG